MCGLCFHGLKYPEALLTFKTTDKDEREHEDLQFQHGGSIRGCNRTQDRAARLYPRLLLRIGMTFAPLLAIKRNRTSRASRFSCRYSCRS